MRVEGTHIQCLRSDKISMHKVTWPLARAVKCRANPTFVTKDAMHDQEVKHTTHLKMFVWPIFSTMFSKCMSMSDYGGTHWWVSCFYSPPHNHIKNQLWVNRSNCILITLTSGFRSLLIQIIEKEETTSFSHWPLCTPPCLLLCCRGRAEKLQNSTSSSLET